MQMGQGGNADASSPAAMREHVKVRGVALARAHARLLHRIWLAHACGGMGRAPREGMGRASVVNGGRVPLGMGTYTLNWERDRLSRYHPGIQAAAAAAAGAGAGAGRGRGRGLARERHGHGHWLPSPPRRD